MKYYAGIGSRQMPKNIIPLIDRVVKILIKQNYCLRSGGASGCDLAFENATNKYEGKSEIFLPYPRFNNNTNKFISIPKKAFDLAEEVHPNWLQCSLPVRKLHARNCMQVLGAKLNKPVEFIMIWALSYRRDKEGFIYDASGGTGQAVRLAYKLNIPVRILNEANIDLIEKIYNKVKINDK